MTEPLRILLIEDEDQDAKLLVLHLQKQGVSFRYHRVAGAEALTEALHRPDRDWNLILSDYSLPDLDIRNRLHWIMGKLPSAPVILVSGTIGEEAAVDLLKAGVEDFVSKDNLVRLVPAIDRAMQAKAARAAQLRAESALALRNRALAAASNGVVIAQADGDMPVVYVNAASERITGYPAGEVMGRNFRLLLAEDRDQPGLQELRAALNSRSQCQVELRNYRKDGSLFWNRLSIAPVTDHHGRVTHFIGIQEDITRQKADEERLRQSAAVFANTSEGMTVTDLAGNILEVNQAFSDITGYRRDEVLGQNPRLLQSGRHGPEFYQAMWTTLREAGHWRGEVWNRRKNGEVYPEWLTLSTVYDEAGEPCNYIGVFADISSIKRSEEQLEYLAHHDPLTGLPNRLLFHARLEHAMEQTRRDATTLAVLFLDLDRFKSVNDLSGQAVGDRLLKEVAERLRGCVRLDDTIARIGGDEFVILLEHVGEPENAGAVARKILQGFGEPFQIEDRTQYLSASIGISIYPGDGEDVASLMRNADTAMYQVKEGDRQGYLYYTEEFTALATERAALENELHRALTLNQLQVYYQPQVDQRSGTLTGAEALLRWQHPERGLISPAVFIPIAEESGLIGEIGSWVLATACAQAQTWLDLGLDFGRVSVNVAGPQIRHGDLVEVTRAALRESGLSPEHLELEVTEGFVMRRAEKAVEHMLGLRRLGVSLAIDDFGTGYSSLSYLKRLPIDRLKIDRSFVRDIPHDGDDAAIARAIIALAYSLGLEVIAEGVETSAQRHFLTEEGCYLAQGYLYARPLPADDFLNWARQLDSASSH